jgi:acyl carrier protein
MPDVDAALAGVAADAPLMDSGLDSLGAVEFRSSLESRLSVQLTPTLVFDYPSLSAIVGYLDSTLAAQQGTSEAAPAEGLAVPSSSLAPRAGPLLQLAAAEQAAAPLIAVLATHGRFPEPQTAARSAGRGLAGQVSLRDGISVVPVERYDVEMRLTEDMPARFGGFLAGAQVS